MLQYAGPEAKPKVPVAMRVVKDDLGEQAADWMAKRWKAGLLRCSFAQKADSIALLLPGTIDSVFDKAAAIGAVLYASDADVLFGKAALTAEEQKFAEAFLFQGQYPQGRCTGKL